MTFTLEGNFDILSLKFLYEIVVFEIHPKVDNF